MCTGHMGASTLERRREGVGQGAGVVDRGHGTLGPCVVGVQEERCCRRWCVAGLLWRGLGPPQEMGDGSRGCTPRGRPVAAKVNPGRGTGGWQSRGTRRLPARPVCISVVLDAKAEKEVIMGSTMGFGSRGGARREEGAAGEESLDRWSAMMRGSPVGGYLVGSRFTSTRCCVQSGVV